MKKYNYYVLEFAIDGNKNHTSSMCVLGYRKPTIEEAKEFWKKDCELYGDETLIDVYEITKEEAYGGYDMSRENELPIFGITRKRTKQETIEYFRYLAYVFSIQARRQNSEFLRGKAEAYEMAAFELKYNLEEIKDEL